MTTQKELPRAFDNLDPGKAAVIRWHMDMGMRLEATRLLIANRRRDGLYVYNLQFKWPKPGNYNTLLMVKAFDDELGCVMAFHSGVSWMSLLLELGERLRAGAVQWRQDEYPPKEWEKWLAYLAKETYNTKEKP